MIKGAGYCLTPGCPRFYQAAFYMGSDKSYRCSICREWGYLEPNAMYIEGYGLCREARVHFKYDPTSKRYRSTAIVTIDTLDPVQNTRVIHSNHPFIMSDVSATRLAEQALANVASGHSGLTIDLCAEDKVFEESLVKLAASLRTSEILRADLGSEFVPLEDNHDFCT
jgi:hypothetical protein